MATPSQELGTSPSKKLDWEQVKAQGSQISILWDYENVPLQYQEITFVKAVKGYFQGKGIIRNFICAANTETMPPHSRRHLYSEGVQIMDVPIRSGDASDIHLVTEIAKIAFMNPPPHVFVLISSDRDFCGMLRLLVQKNYFVVAILNEMSHNFLLMKQICHETLHRQDFDEYTAPVRELSHEPILIIDPSSQNIPVTNARKKTDRLILRLINAKHLIQINGWDSQNITQLSIDGWFFFEESSKNSSGTLVSKNMCFAIAVQNMYVHVGFNNKNGELVKTPVMVPVMEWVHIGVCFEKNGKTTIYLNGAKAYECHVTLNPGDSTYDHCGPVMIGSIYVDQSNKILARDIRIWSCVLSEPQVRDSLLSTEIIDKRRLVGWWPLNEGTASILDLSLNGFRGSLSGGQWIREGTNRIVA